MTNDKSCATTRYPTKAHKDAHMAWVVANTPAPWERIDPDIKSQVDAEWDRRIREDRKFWAVVWAAFATAILLGAAVCIFLGVM